MDITFLYLLQIAIIVIVILVIFLFIKRSESLKKERRISRYSINSKKSNSISIWDNLADKYKKFIIKLRKPLSKSYFLSLISRRYEKYVPYGSGKKAIDFISHKLVIANIFVILTIFTKVIQSSNLDIYLLLLDFILGFYILDIYLIIDKKRKRRIIQDQILRAVIIMNNAFKAGRSTLQAVEIASKELAPPINYEFEKMYKDMKYGLSVDSVFDRFAKRINIEEARYISSSLTVLSKTGGNIVNVFSAIERTLFDKKKLKAELKNLTASSNMIVKILLAVPFVFILLIYVLNPNYFDPLFASPLGYMLLLLIFLILITYVWFLQKLMKVRF